MRDHLFIWPWPKLRATPDVGGRERIKAFAAPPRLALTTVASR